MTMQVVDYSVVTERGGERGSRAQLARAYGRYHFARCHAEGKDVVEVAAGVGQGLGYLARKARSVIGVDIDPANIAAARETYKHRPSIRIERGDAENLELDDASCDVVILFEALYYLREPERFFRHARRLLRPGGLLMMCTANKDLPDFNPSPFAHRYFGPPEFVAALEPLGFEVSCFGEDPIGPPSLRRRGFELTKRWAVRRNLIPGTMQGKAFLKRLVFGSLVELPRELEEGGVEPTPIRFLHKDVPDHEHRVIHAVARVR